MLKEREDEIFLSFFVSLFLLFCIYICFIVLVINLFAHRNLMAKDYSLKKNSVL